MSFMSGGGESAAQKQARESAQKSTQSSNEETQRSRQAAERGRGGRGRNMLAGRLSEVLPTNLAGTK